MAAPRVTEKWRPPLSWIVYAVLLAVLAFCVVLALALSTPVLLPLLIPVAIVWLLVSRNRKQAQARQHSL